MAAPRKYPDELRERATRLAVETRKDPAARTGAVRRIGGSERWSKAPLKHSGAM
ncbi:hypothetical protein [Streptomyces fulvorobeus]|uniref:Transposase n=1 Tax=Streptomyces fulvorobeus TaxID=284028 RepID=A0A7J0C3C0_9ACTN|nr:hypothetical protein [Streptomyces fulvorobeus]NYE40659.1 hypothetical protein [Streptomyces fulvorobeus]GFM96961.1 hypothetical protein Sfulv_17720 [Streptomyces fulvorobeus]